MEIELLGLVATIIAGSLTAFWMQTIKRMSDWVDSLSPIAKRAAVLLLAFGASQVASAIGVPLPTDPTTWGGDVLNTIITALLAMAAHAAKKVATKK